MASSQIIEAINSMLDRLAAIPFDWSAYMNTISNGLIATTDMPDATKLFQNLALWNNQPKQWKNGKGLPTSKPNVYVQPIFGKPVKMGFGVTLYPEFVFRIHIIDYQIDGFNEAGGVAGTNSLIGGLDQNFEIFNWRDLVKTQLQLFFPLHCGALTVCDEAEDSEHEDLIHYTIDFKTSFSDLKGGQLDPDQTKVIHKDPPVDPGYFGLQENINISN